MRRTQPTRAEETEPLRQQKLQLAILGVGFVAGTTLVIGMDRIMKKIFVNEDWPDEEWSSDDWAEEDLEG